MLCKGKKYTANLERLIYSKWVEMSVYPMYRCTKKQYSTQDSLHSGTKEDGFTGAFIIETPRRMGFTVTGAFIV